MSKKWLDLRRRHAVEAHEDERLETFETELYDQDAEEFPNAVTVLPSHCGLCGYGFKQSPWDAEVGSLCPVCGARTVIRR